jgi:hydrogenase maturation protein HypF
VNRRTRIAVRGAVQGVGFRPFVYALAAELRLAGWVQNSPQGVQIEVEGEVAALEEFQMRLTRDRPPHAFFTSLELTWLDAAGANGFEIRPSAAGGERRALVLPDIAICADCRREVLDPDDRRHQYPFTNCTHCGPRYTIVEALPYDRAHTTMKHFPMCAACRAEYDDPANRRFHAQPNACPDCGPQLELWEPGGRIAATRHQALCQAAAALRDGQVVAVKGLGGFHLLVDARNEGAVHRLRARKQREEKPLALLFPTLAAIEAACDVSAAEARLLQAPEAPIVLLRRRAGDSGLAPSVAPHNPYLGAMLPYTPLHLLLLHELGFPVVATSGNLSEEPICTDEREALLRLDGVADLFLVHDRPIVRHVDDSVVRVLLGREQVLRRARGYAPLPVPGAAGGPVLLAVGGQLKNTVALAMEGEVFLSQHIGDLDNYAAATAHHAAIASLCELYAAAPEHVAADLHPDYVSTRAASALGLPVLGVQHHHAHVAACAAENALRGPVLGVAWDGTGYGPDGTVWGGEFLLVDGSRFERVAALRPFRLPGGERAVREGRRSALALLYEIFGDQLAEVAGLHPLRAFTPAERTALLQMLARGVNSPLTSSAGRLFDAVAALVGLRQSSHFEGQAAMELEFAVAESAASPQADEPYPVSVTAYADGAAAARPDGAAFAAAVAPRWIFDWEPLVRSLLADLEHHVPLGVLARRFHITLAAAIVEVARLSGEHRVVLTGGCFQNAFLTAQAVQRLRAAGFDPYWHQRVPPNDGSIALGQAAVAAHALEGRECHVPRSAR